MTVPTVKVKPLVWTEITDDDCDHETYAFGLRWWVTREGTERFALFCNSRELGPSSTLEAAKAAAQADYEDRVLSAIDTTDLDAAVNEALERAAVMVGTMQFPVQDSVDASVGLPPVGQRIAASIRAMKKECSDD